VNFKLLANRGLSPRSPTILINEFWFVCKSSSFMYKSLCIPCD